MNWNDYKVMSEKTLSTSFYCDDKIELMLHAVMGILTEMEEILDNDPKNPDVINIREEAGDITWYLAIIGRLYNIGFPIDLPVSSEDPMKTSISIIKHSCKLLDMLKKKLFYDKVIDENLFRENAVIIMILINSYMKYYNIDIQESFDINIAKLKSRYGDKFSSERAINRDLDTERKILEEKEILEKEDKIVLEEEDLVSDPVFSRDDLVNTGSFYLDGIFPNNSDMYLD